MIGLEAQLSRRNWELAERVKELECLHGLSRLRERSDLGMSDLLREAVRLIPPAWQHPDRARARLTVLGETYATDALPGDGPLLQAELRDGAEVLGLLEVAYGPGPGPAPDFLPEERALLATLAQALGAAVAQVRAAQRIGAYQVQLRALASELALQGERERRRIARELHDQIGHTLAAAKHRLTRLRARSREPELGEALGLLDEAIRASRDLTFELSPPVLHELGLGAALEWLVHQARARFGLAAVYVGDARPKPLEEDQRVVIFQAVRELLANVAKHARAGCARVEARVAGRELVVEVSDDGVGFDPGRLGAPDGPTGLGLFGIRERLAHLGITLDLRSGPGEGTRVRLRAPLRERTRPGPQVSLPPVEGPRVRLLLAEDQTLAREGLRALLGAHPDLEVVAEAADGEEAVEACGRHRPDVVVMDIAMPGLNGLEATRRILAQWPATKVVALSMHADPQYVLEMLRAGASGYLLKDCAQEDLAQAIRAVQANLSFLSPGLAAHMAAAGMRPAPAAARLTAREVAVVKLLARGRSTKEAASDLEISPKTVETHRQHAMEKLGVDNLAGLTRWAIREGLVSSS